MKRTNAYSLIVLLFCFCHVCFAGTPDLAGANKLFNFTEMAEPTLFFPPAQTQQINAEGSDWFYRYFSGSDSYVAININGVGPFFEGDVYVVGDQFGEDPLFVDTLDNLVAVIDSIESPLSGGENAITNPGNGNCVERKFPPKNDTARYQTTTFSGETSSVTERSELYQEVTNAITITVIGQSSTVDNIQNTISTRLTSYFESLNGLFFLSEKDSAITTAGLSPSNQNVNITYAPSLFIGPTESLCEGQEWFAASVTQTLVDDPDLSGNGPVISQTAPTAITVDNIGGSVTVQGGTFSTIKMTLTYPNSRVVIWTDLGFGVIVMSESYQGDSESPSSMEELVQIDLPF